MVNGEAAPVALSLVDVAALDDLPPGTVMRAEAGACVLALVNVRGRVMALADLCLRCGSSLSNGQLTGGELTCSRCGWKYDVERRCVAGLPALRVDMHEVRLDGGRIFVAALLADSPVPRSC